MIYYSCILTSWEALLSWPVPVQLSYDVYDSCILNICILIIYDICILFNNKNIYLQYNENKLAIRCATKRHYSLCRKMWKWPKKVRLRQLYPLATICRVAALRLACSRSVTTMLFLLCSKETLILTSKRRRGQHNLTTFVPSMVRQLQGSRIYVIKTNEICLT